MEQIAYYPHSFFILLILDFLYELPFNVVAAIAIVMPKDIHRVTSRTKDFYVILFLRMKRGEKNKNYLSKNNNNDDYTG